MKSISLITTSFNSAETILDTIHSVNLQKYSEIEHIVIDGGSKDATLDIVRQFGQRITKVISEPDKGIYDAYNKGIDQASGDIIGFINSDDFYCSDHVIDNVACVFEDPEIDACYADLVYVNPEHVETVERFWKSKPITKRNLQNGFIPAHPTVFVRKSVYDKVGKFDLNYKYAADYEMLLRMFHEFQIKSEYVPQVWVRMRSGGHTGGNYKSILDQNEEILQARRKRDIRCTSAKFYGLKIIDRVAQRLRAPFVNAPNIELIR
ncbi:glycosyltransferase family 2 protein [Maritalea sp. S77]|uniref:glycosyltransferase family 2 protein n=1 Tax=Maritalea sp. S77 TaxID=3415125 RepID=UPI003C7CD77D